MSPMSLIGQISPIGLMSLINQISRRISWGCPVKAIRLISLIRLIRLTKLPAYLSHLAYPAHLSYLAYSAYHSYHPLPSPIMNCEL